MIISTTRFGNIEVQEEDVLNFPEGILGFNELRNFVLLDDPNDEIFAWLQSSENPAVAFPVLEPELFLDSYKITLTKSDLEALQLIQNQWDKTHIFTIVTIPDDPIEMTANLKAPVIVNLPLKIARQCVLQDNNLAIREPIFARLQQRVVQYPNQSLKSKAISLDVAVKIPLQENSEENRQEKLSLQEEI